MKKSLSSLILLLAVVLAGAFTGCKQSPAEQADAMLAEMAGKVAVPVKINENTTLTACYYADKMLTYRNETTPKVLADINVDSLKNLTLERLTTNLNSQKLCAKIVEIGGKVRYIYVAESDSIMFTFSADDLRRK